MLPDWPELKSEMRHRLDEFLRQRHQFHLKSFAEIPRYRIFEGRDTETVRAGGDVDKTKMKSARSEIIYDSKTTPDLTLDEILKKLDEIAKDMADQIAGHFYETMAEVCEKHGNVVDAGGRELTPEVWLETLEKVWIDFDSHGKPKLPELHISEPAGRKLIQALEGAKQSEQYQRKFNEVIAKKRHEFHAREASRKLVG